MALLLHQFIGRADQQTSIRDRALAILPSGRDNPEQILSWHYPSLPPRSKLGEPQLQGL